jgi:hypothetical protein
MRDTQRVGLAAGLLVVLGCAALIVWFRHESEPTLTGAIRVDGKLLAKGSIALAPIHGTAGPGGGGGIDKDGKYEITRGLQPGKYRVEIRSSITLSRQVRNPTIPSELVDEEVSAIPEEYNTKSNLVREIKQGANVLDFNLKGPEPRN